MAMHSTSLLLLLVLGALLARDAQAQSYIDQTEVEELLGVRAEHLDDIPEVYYDYYVLQHPQRNTVLARNAFYKHIGGGNIETGYQHAKLVELLNRKLTQNLDIGDTLVVPTRYGLDFRAYSPFPRYYPGGRHFDKLFVLDKRVQAFAAYEYGQLLRWGVVNTGDPAESPTPTGRYNFNWKEEYRVSSLSPEDEPWEMYWVFNFHSGRGIHIHQYAFPTGGPTSHGCVRLLDADAKWVFHWADAWKTTAGTTGFTSAQSRLVEQGTTVLVVGEDPTGNPRPFAFKQRYPILKRVELPNHPYDVPPGTAQQRLFDRLRAQQASASTPSAN